MEEISLQTRYSDHILDQFNRARAELIETIEGPGPIPQDGEKENIPDRNNSRNNIKISTKLSFPQGGSTTTTTDSGAGTFRSSTVEH